MRMFLRSLLVTFLLWLPQPVWCDTFTIREDDGNTAVIDARLIGEGRGVVALERTDGRIEIVPQQQVMKRVVGSDPEPITCETMIKRLKEKFGEDKFRFTAAPPYVIGLILSEPLTGPKSALYNRNAAICLKKGAAFMKEVEKGFDDYVRKLKIDLEKPRYPLVVLVFETDDDFVRFHAEDTGGRGLAAEVTQGYFNPLTNRLVIRMSECHTFATPLHEAVHQQVYNRSFLRRLAPIPVWFDEGIATGFEGDGDGTKIKNGPLKINTRYARRAMQATTVNWDDVVADDKAFRGDILAGEAYAHAWSIHWFLLTKYQKKYIEFLQVLREKPPLQIDDAETRTQDFERVFGKRIGQLQSEFPAWLHREAERLTTSSDDAPPPGFLKVQTNLAEVEMKAADAEGESVMVAEGRMRNLSQVRPMSFHIAVVTGGGSYAEWYIPNAAPLKETALPRQIARKQMKDSPGYPPRTFQIKVKTTVPDSETDRAWQRGEFPVPVWSGH